MTGQHVQLHYQHTVQRVSDDTYYALVAECKRLGINDVRDLMVTDAPDHPAGPGVRYRCWIRTGNGIRGGRHEATVQAAADSLLDKLRRDAA